MYHCITQFSMMQTSFNNEYSMRYNIGTITIPYANMIYIYNEYANMKVYGICVKHNCSQLRLLLLLLLQYMYSIYMWYTAAINCKHLQTC